jgi:drug/metabolite transporter (DMT)-like permease
VVVIGSGATAATLIPAMADACAHVTMLQRSPTYFRTARNVNDLADLLRELDIPETWTHEIVRRKILLEQGKFAEMARRHPDAVKRELVANVRSILGPDFDVERHFSPHYRPWQQRLAFIPDADLFKTIASGQGSVVTDEIECFTADGLRLKSGDTLKADVIVTATGFELSALGEIPFTIDGRPLAFHDTVTWNGAMFTGVPNLLWVFGYLRWSWTLRVDLLGDFVCRLLDDMQQHGARVVTPQLRPDESTMPRRPWVDPDNFNPGYLMRGQHRLPQTGRPRALAARAGLREGKGHAAACRPARRLPDLRVSTSGAANRRGILYMAAAMVCLVLNDSLMKHLGRSLPVPQMVFVRGVFAVLMVFAVARGTGATTRLPQLADRRVLARATVDAVGTLLYLVALMHLPLGNATAINLAAPLIMAALGVFVLHERAGAARWAAIGAGFVGVLLVIQPRAQGFNAWALVCLSGTFFQALRELLTRRIDPTVPALLITLASALAVMLLAAAATLAQGWQPVSALQLATLALAAALLATGYFFIVNCMRHGDMTVVAPFRYTGLLVAVLLGWLFWDEVPNALAWTGITVLLGAGLVLLRDGALLTSVAGLAAGVLPRVQRVDGGTRRLRSMLQGRDRGAPPAEASTPATRSGMGGDLESSLRRRAPPPPRASAGGPLAARHPRLQGPGPACAGLRVRRRGAQPSAGCGSP